MSNELVKVGEYAVSPEGKVALPELGPGRYYVAGVRSATAFEQSRTFDGHRTVDYLPFDRTLTFPEKAPFVRFPPIYSVIGIYRETD